MMLVEEQKNSFGQRILSRDGRWICSPRDPVKEAAEWCRRQKLVAEDRTAVVLGGGAGHHLLQLAAENSKLKILAVELDPTTLSSTEMFLQTNGLKQERVEIIDRASAEALICTQYDIVLNFRPAWAGFENQYMALYFQLTQNSASSLARAAEKNHMPLTGQVLKEKLSEIQFSLKDLDFQESEDPAKEVKFWRVLRELID